MVLGIPGPVLGIPGLVLGDPGLTWALPGSVLGNNVSASRGGGGILDASGVGKSEPDIKSRLRPEGETGITSPAASAWVGIRLVLVGTVTGIFQGASLQRKYGSAHEIFKNLGMTAAAFCSLSGNSGYFWVFFRSILHFLSAISSGVRVPVQSTLPPPKTLPAISLRLQTSGIRSSRAIGC